MSRITCSWSPFGEQINYKCLAFSFASDDLNRTIATQTNVPHFSKACSPDGVHDTPGEREAVHCNSGTVKCASGSTSSDILLLLLLFCDCGKMS